MSEINLVRHENDNMMMNGWHIRDKRVFYAHIISARIQPQDMSR